MDMEIVVPKDGKTGGEGTRSWEQAAEALHYIQ